MISSGAYSIFRVGAEIFLSDAELRLKGADYFLPPSPILKNTLPLGIKTRGEAENLSITKERLVLVSAPYAPNERFFH